MLKIYCILILMTAFLSPAAWSGFEVYTGNLKVFEQDIGIKHCSKGIPRTQCLRSRYGRTDTAWPCVIDHRYIPGDVQARRLYIYTTPYRDKVYSPGMRRLIATKP